jgi:hypothetical protein
MYILAYAYNESERAVCMFMSLCVCHLIRTELTKYKKNMMQKCRGKHVQKKVLTVHIRT